MKTVNKKKMRIRFFDVFGEDTYAPEGTFAVSEHGEGIVEKGSFELSLGVKIVGVRIYPGLKEITIDIQKENR